MPRLYLFVDGISCTQAIFHKTSHYWHDCIFAFLLIRRLLYYPLKWIFLRVFNVIIRTWLVNMWHFSFNDIGLSAINAIMVQVFRRLKIRFYPRVHLNLFKYSSHFLLCRWRIDIFKIWSSPILLFIFLLLLEELFELFFYLWARYILQALFMILLYVHNFLFQLFFSISHLV